MPGVREGTEGPAEGRSPKSWMFLTWEDVSPDLHPEFFAACTRGLLARLDRLRPEDAAWLRTEITRLAELFNGFREYYGPAKAHTVVAAEIAWKDRPRVGCSCVVVNAQYEKGLRLFKDVRVRELREGRPTRTIQDRAESFLRKLADFYPCPCGPVVRLDAGFWSSDLTKMELRSRRDFVIALLARHHHLTYDGVDRLLKEYRRFESRRREAYESSHPTTT
jgi:hypothetical protein